MRAAACPTASRRSTGRDGPRKEHPAPGGGGAGSPAESCCLLCQMARLDTSPGAPHPCAHDDRRGAVTYACSTRCEMQSVSERGGSMAKLIYSAITSLDGYVADEDGNFDWAAPDEEVHSFVNDLERPVGTYLYGRRMYEVMVYWETVSALADQPPFVQTSRRSGRRPTRSCTPGRWRRFPAPGRGSSETSTLKRSGSLKRQRDVTSAWAVPTSPLRRSGLGWSTSFTCSSRPSWWEAATSPCPTTSACSSNCWTNAGSAAAWWPRPPSPPGTYLMDRARSWCAGAVAGRAPVMHGRAAGCTAARPCTHVQLVLYADRSVLPIRGKGVVEKTTSTGTSKYSAIRKARYRLGLYSPRSR